ncbi:MAG: hypothetical protein A2Y38_18715 [Spirochaetes bacterium GWB1_59_5]|nr:MAG: hypothetical protein A2Y38_18715 [Spirochaetes bacterium GWB1_59_5]
MAFDPWAQTNQGLSNLTNTLGTLAQLKRQDQQYADEAPDRAARRTLADLQLQGAQRKNTDELALRDALSNAKGGYLYPEPAGMGPVQPGQEPALSGLGPAQQPASAQARLDVMSDLASKGNTAAMSQYGDAYSLNQKMAEQKAKVAEYGDAEGAAKIDIILGKMDKSGKLLEQWMKADPTGNMAKQGIAANPDIFNNFDPSKMKLGSAGEPPVFFDAPDGGKVYYDGKEWKHVAKKVDNSVTEFETFLQAGKESKKDLPTILAEWNTQEVERKKAGATRVSTNVTTKEQTEEAKTVGKGQGERYNDIVKQGDTGFRQKNMYGRLESLLKDVNTGKLTPAGTQIAATAASLGINIDKNLGNKQAAIALSNQLTLELRNPAGGAGMPGAMSDADRNFLAASVPNLGNSPEGNLQMIQYAQAMAQRSIDVSKLATKYRQKNGTLDVGFNTELQNWSDTHPLFSADGKANTKSQFDAAESDQAAPKGLSGNMKGNTVEVGGKRYPVKNGIVTVNGKKYRVQ